MHAAVVKLSIDGADAPAAARLTDDILPRIRSVPGVTIDEVEYHAVEESAEVDREKKYDTVVSSGQSALRALLAMNGGAVVVFLTFISHLLEEETRKVAPESMRLFVFAFSWFIGGIVLTLASYGAIFVTNVLSSEGWERHSNGAFLVTVLFGLLALACFIGGCWTAITAFQSVGGSIIARR